MQGFLVSFCMAILEKALTKGTKAFAHYLALKKELEQNKSKAGEYQKVVDAPNTTRQERKDAEDSLLS